MTPTDPDHDSQEEPADCLDATLGRRDLLRTTAGVALLGTAGVPQPAAARRTAPGEERWNTRVGAVEAAPAVTEETVFVGSSNANLHALDRETGEERWSFGGEDRASRQSSPTVVDGTVFVGSFEGTVYAVDAESGAGQWRFEAGGGVFTTPAVVDGTVFVGSRDTNVYALDAGTGEELWRHGTGDEVWGDPTVVDGTVLVGSDDGRLYALDADDGSSVWEFESSVIQGGGTTVADGTVYFSARSLHALDMEGEERWSVRGGAKEAVAVVDGTVFVGESGGTVRARDAANGEEIW
jgi:outer membrane protein assembly factor BamB